MHALVILFALLGFGTFAFFVLCFAAMFLHHRRVARNARIERLYTGHADV